VQRLLARSANAGPETLPDLPLLIVEDRGRRGRFVANCCVRASRSGVKADMPLAEAVSLLDAPPTLRPLDEEGDRRALENLAKAFVRFSPRISLETDSPVESLLFDIAGVAPLFGDERRLAGEASKVAGELGYRTWIATAATQGAAWAASRYLAKESEPAIVSPDEVERLLDLPIEALRLSADVALAFRTLGIESIRQAAELPRDAVKARFGDEVSVRLDQLLDRRLEATCETTPDAEYVAAWSSEFPARNGGEVTAALTMLLERLAVELRAADRGVVELHCTFTEERGTIRERTLRLCEPVASPRELAKLFALELERSPIRGAIGAVRIEAIETAKLLPKQRDLFAGGDQGDPTKLGELLDRLGSRLGRENVVRPALMDDPVPERSFALLPVSAKKSRRRKPAAAPAPHQRPLRLHPDPLAIDVIAIFPEGAPRVFALRSKRYEIASAHGPERIEAAWWRGETVRRDYWRVATTTGGRFWLFRRLQDGRWFLHGDFA
jgi:protein ImuB